MNDLREGALVPVLSRFTVVLPSSLHFKRITLHSVGESFDPARARVPFINLPLLHVTTRETLNLTEKVLDVVPTTE